MVVLEFVVALVVAEEQIVQELREWKQDQEELLDLPSLLFSFPSRNYKVV